MLTKKQTELVLHKFLQEDGLNSVLEMMLNAMMYGERSDYLSNCSENKVTLNSFQNLNLNYSKVSLR